MPRTTVSTVVAAICLLACSPDGTERRAAPPKASAEAPAEESGMISGDTVAGARPAGLEGVLSRLAAGNTAEIETSRLAAERARLPEVRQVARHILAEHRRSKAELEALARKDGVALVPADSAAERDDGGLRVLQGAQGAAFDNAYLGGQIETHRANIDAIRNQMLPTTDEPAARQFLEKTLAAMEDHLGRLERVRGDSPS